VVLKESAVVPTEAVPVRDDGQSPEDEVDPDEVDPDEVDPDEVDRDEVDPVALAKAIVLRRLAAASRTRHELQVLLAERGIAVDVAEQVLDRFTELGYLDDKAFADAWVVSRHRSRGLARGAIAQELRRRGVDEEIAESALAQISPSQEAERARALAVRKAARMSQCDDEVALRRLTGVLMRRGFHWSVALSAAQQALVDRTAGAACYGLGHNATD